MTGAQAGVRVRTRRRLGGFAVIAATLTAVAGAVLGAPAAAAVWAGIAVVALSRPGWIPIQVLSGQAMAAGLLLRPDGPGPLLVMAIIAGVIATAELLAAVARQATPLVRDSGGELRRAGMAAATGAVIFGVVFLLADFPGPTGCRPSASRPPHVSCSRSCSARGAQAALRPHPDAADLSSTASRSSTGR